MRYRWISIILVEVLKQYSRFRSNRGVVKSNEGSTPLYEVDCSASTRRTHCRAGFHFTIVGNGKLRSAAKTTNHHTISKVCELAPERPNNAVAAQYCNTLTNSRAPNVLRAVSRAVTKKTNPTKPARKPPISAASWMRGALGSSRGSIRLRPARCRSEPGRRLRTGAFLVTNREAPNNLVGANQEKKALNSRSPLLRCWWKSV